MFGYVRPYKPELRFKEYDVYKAVYCSLCREIGRRYGRMLRFSLSYDFTFLALLYLSLREGPVSLEKKRCVCNPAKKCQYFTASANLTLPAAASVMMVYYKVCDNIADEGFWKSGFYRVLKMLMHRAHRRAAAEFPALEQAFSNYIAEQSRLEQEPCEGVDAAAEPTAKMLSVLFAACSPNGETRALKRMGYCMGRWIYLIDAAADLSEDQKKGRFNPFSAEFEKGAAPNGLKERVVPLLNISAADAVNAFELLDICRFKNILGNILYLGLENSTAYLFLKGKTKV